MKKILLFNVMLAGSCTMALAAGPFQTYRIVTNEYDKSASILSVLDGVTLEGDVEIPSTVTRDGVKYTVTEIGFGNYESPDCYLPDDASPGYPAFYSQKKMTSIYIPSTITYIAPNAFMGCTGLTRFRVSSESQTFRVVDDVLYYFNGDWDFLIHYPAAKEGSSFTLPDHLPVVEPWAFASAKYLTTLYIDASHRSLAAGWSLGNNTISSIKIKSKSANASVYYKIINGMLITANDDQKVQLVAVPPAKEYELLNIPSEVTEIARLALANSRIKAVAIPSTVKTIGDEAFRYSRINSIAIPSTVKEIGYGLFRDCRSLTTATVNAAVKDLPEWTFEGCTALSSARLGISITNISPHAYQGCASLKSYSLNGIKTMEYNNMGRMRHSPGIFMRSGLESINWPSTVTTIPAQTFYDCYDLKSITLKEETREIQELAFHQTAIETFNTMNLTRIENDVFANCSDLRKLVIADSPNRLLLGKRAFWVGQNGSNTQVYINHKDVGLIPFYGNSSDDKDWGHAFYRMGDYTCYSSRLTPPYFPSDWTALYVPARVKDYYNTNFNSLGGEIYEMFAYEPDLDNRKVKITPNYSWIKITGVRFDDEAGVKSGDPAVWTAKDNAVKPTEVTIDYTVNGVKMTTTYTAKYNSGIGDIEFDETDTPVEYYDLHGNKVDTPTHGIYIRRQGSHCEKIIL